MNLDLRTLLLAAMLTSLLLAVGLQLVTRTIVDEPSLRLWSRSAWFTGFSYVLLAFRGVLPDLLSIVLANMCLVVGAAFLYLGHRKFFGLRNQFPWYWLVVFFSAVALLYFAYLVPSLVGRILIVSVATASTLIAGAIVLLRSGDSSNRSVRRFLAVVSLLGALILLLRAVLAPFPINAPGQDFIANVNPTLPLTLVFGVGLNMALAFGIPFLVLEKLQRHLVLALDATALSIWDIDLATDTLRLDAHWSQMMGGTPGETVTTGSALIALTHPDDVALALKSAIQTMKGLENDFRSESRIKTASGKWKWIRCSGTVIERDGKGHALRAIGTNLDITEQRNAQEKIRQLAFHDPLTALPNRRLMLDRLNQALSQLRRHDRELAVMFLDVDGFKKVNDSLGHEAGDELLQLVAQRLTGCVRMGDTVARLGGDEFVIVLTEIGGLMDVSTIAEKILNTLAVPVELAGQRLLVTTSIGISISSAEEDMDANELLKRADAAMYAVKKSGRNNYLVFHPDSVAARSKLMELATTSGFDSI